MKKQLYRPRKNRVFAGVCGGFSEYFDIDPTIVRIVCLIICMTGAGFFAYIVSAFIMPDESKISYNTEDWKTGSDENEWNTTTKYDSGKNKMTIGVILVGLGILFFANQLFGAYFMRFMVPLFLIFIGGFIIYNGKR